MKDPITWYFWCRAVSYAPDWFMMYGVHISITCKALRRGISWHQQLSGLCLSHSGYGIQRFVWLIGDFIS